MHHHSKSINLPKLQTADKEVTDYISRLLTGLNGSTKPFIMKSAINDDIVQFMNVEDFLSFDEVEGDEFSLLSHDEQLFYDMAID